MKSIPKQGEIRTYSKRVASNDLAMFHDKIVHAVCSTFALARDMEWTTRLFVLDICDGDEEGIGTFVHVNHHAPAFAHELLEFTGKIEQVKGNELICSVTATVGSRLVATGKTGQKILKREKINQLFERR